MKRQLIFLTAIIATTIPALTASAQNDDLTRVLISEIRQLRQEMQKIAASNLQSELLLERVRIQSSLVQTLSRELEDRKNGERYQRMEEQMNYGDQYREEMKARLATVTDPNERRQIQREMEMFERRLEMDEQRRRDEEARTLELQRRLDRAEASLAEYFSAIDLLVKQLAAGE